jgi:hypothetical protein
VSIISYGRSVKPPPAPKGILGGYQVDADSGLNR